MKLRILSEIEIKEFMSKLLRWFSRHRRDLPWRRTKDPYRTWISEIMLQQTTVPAVIPYYQKWMKIFPTLRALAKAPSRKILKTWQGLGYYQRAKNIHKTSKIILKSFKGKIPDSYDELVKLPGIGAYSAGAILSIAYNKRFPALEANSLRVLSRILCLEDPFNSKIEKQLNDFQSQLLPLRSAGNFNQALMELGSLVCRNKNPLCLKCPVKSFCQAYQRGKQELIPFKKQKKKAEKIEAVIGIILKDNKILIQKRPSKGLLADLWEFPGGKIKPGESKIRALRRELKEELGFEIDGATFIQKVNHSYTDFRVTLYSYLCHVDQVRFLKDSSTQSRWVTRKSIRQYPFPSGSARIADHLHNHWDDLN
jgi:A/G-specific adenine glycosylase